ncbi:cytochrome c oxidase assembly protein, partial [Streptomyces sp. P17]|nr:cytochrome c oxidase assembly protein [Streptomyces sp. P17]
AIALLAPVVVGQILVGPGHDFGTDAGTVQTIAAAALFGSGILLALRVWRGRLLRPATLRRFWLLGVVAWALAAGAAIVLA